MCEDKTTVRERLEAALGELKHIDMAYADPWRGWYCVGSEESEWLNQAQDLLLRIYGRVVASEDILADPYENEYVRGERANEPYPDTRPAGDPMRVLGEMIAKVDKNRADFKDFLVLVRRLESLGGDWRGALAWATAELVGDSTETPDDPDSAVLDEVD